MNEANRGELILLSPGMVAPFARLGSTLQEAAGPQPSHLAEIFEAHAAERHVLFWRDGRSYVVLKDGAQRVDLLRALWQVGGPPLLDCG